MRLQRKNVNTSIEIKIPNISIHMTASETKRDMAPPLTAAQIEAYAAMLQETYQSAQKHPRYQMRSLSLSAIAGGSILNFISVIVALVERPNGPRFVTVIAGMVVFKAAPLHAFIPQKETWIPDYWEQYLIATLYQSLDLLSGCLAPKSKDQKFGFLRRHIPSEYVLAIDTLGFLGFLALLIANGIVVHDLYDGQQMYVYNSVPWMVCW